MTNSTSSHWPVSIGAKASWLAFALFVVGTLGCSEGRAPQHPDVILVVVDTLRADRMSLHGYARATTPKLDAFAQSGAVFEACQAASSWTLPSMSMLFAGAYDGRNSGQMDQAWPTLAESFQGAGYTTGAVVANPILGTTVEPGTFGAGFRRSFDHYELAPKRFGMKPRVKAQTNGWYADEVVRRGIRQLRKGGDQPQFLWLQMFDPHFPRRPAKPELFRDQPNPSHALGAEVTAEEQTYIDEEQRLYAAEVAGADAAFGDLIHWLASEGRLENTIVVLTSDHGEGLWQRALPTGETAKKKNQVPRLYSDHGIMVTAEQVHVPLVMVGPGIEPSQRFARHVSLVDLAPTLRRLADLPVSGAPDLIAGRDLFEAPEARPVYSFCSRSASVTVDNKWRLVAPSQARATNFGDTAKLYNLEADGEELAPVWDAHGKLASADSAPDPLQLAKQLEAFRALAMPDVGDLDAAAQAARRALLDDLGYVDQ